MALLVKVSDCLVRMLGRMVLVLVLELVLILALVLVLVLVVVELPLTSGQDVGDQHIPNFHYDSVEKHNKNSAEERAKHKAKETAKIRVSFADPVDTTTTGFCPVNCQIAALLVDDDLAGIHYFWRLYCGLC